MAGLSSLLRRWRCWWHRPLGHVDELIEYVDRLSGRWAARARCARCGREAGLAVGEAKHGTQFHDPLATMLSRQGVKVSVPPAEKLGFGPPPGRPGGIEIDGPDGRGIYVRRVRARFALGRSRDVYLAVVLENSASPIFASNLRAALAQVLGPADEAWLDRATRQLDAELPASS